MSQLFARRGVCRWLFLGHNALSVLTRPLFLTVCLSLPAATTYAVEPVDAAVALPSPPRFSAAVTQSYDWDHWNVVGSIREHRVQGYESLLEIARDYGLGYHEIVRANPDLDPFLPGAGVKALIPAARVLPVVPFDQGIVINLAEKRLYYFHRQNEKRLVVSFPVGIGTTDANTPTGDFTITTKLVNPSWTVPPSIREKRPYLPAVFPPGPENPMGSHALQLSRSSYFIHGTHRPWSIGRRATHGCVRMYPEDIPILFAMTPPNTPVRIVHQAIKIGWREGAIYIEVHHDKMDDHDGRRWHDYRAEAEKILQEKGLEQKIDEQKLAEAIRRGQGMAVPIGQMKQKPNPGE